MALVDVRMPEMDGIEATRRITASGSSCRVLMLTTFDVDEHVYDAFRAGATGFLLKTVAPEDLVSAVCAAAGGDALLAPSITRRLIERFVAAPGPAETTGSACSPTGSARCSGWSPRACRTPEIAAELFVSHGTVETHVARVLMKLGLRDRVQAVIFAYESGVVSLGARREPMPE